jgi:Glycerophosphoryl diester phosphodiesterase
MIKHLVTCLLAMTSVVSTSIAEPLIVGHRGASFAAPENTVASIREAWKEGADGTELDIYLTKDGKLVTIHDKTTKRTAGLDRDVMEQTLEELRKLDAGSWKDARWKGEKIATLEESLAAIPDGKIVYIELKGGEEVLPELKRVLDASPKPRKEIYLIDFKLENLIEAKKSFPDLQKLWIVGAKTDKQTKEKTYPPIAGLVKQAKEAGMDGLDLNGGFPLDEAAVSSIKAEKLQLAVWTVDEAADAKRLAKAGVDAITTNRPEFIRAALKE